MIEANQWEGAGHQTKQILLRINLLKYFCGLNQRNLKSLLPSNIPCWSK